jgi:hypothetical protein
VVVRIGLMFFVRTFCKEKTMNQQQTEIIDSAIEDALTAIQDGDDRQLTDSKVRNKEEH